MAKKQIKADSKHAKDHDNKLVETGPYLNLEKSHTDWYDVHEMGKQKGRPRYSPRDTKKSKGNFQRHQHK